MVLRYFRERYSWSSYLEDGTPVMGLPGCVMYAKATVFDLVLPRIIAGIEVTKKDLAHMGNGGFCLGCKDATTQLQLWKGRIRAGQEE